MSGNHRAVLLRVFVAAAVAALGLRAPAASADPIGYTMCAFSGLCRVDLESFEIVLNYIRSTKTQTGLRVTARILEREYAAGIKITDDQMRELALTRHADLPRWNYTVSPEPKPAATTPSREDLPPDRGQESRAAGSKPHPPTPTLELLPSGLTA